MKIDDKAVEKIKELLSKGLKKAQISRVLRLDKTTVGKFIKRNPHLFTP